jgi:hypothetical protein
MSDKKKLVKDKLNQETNNSRLEIRELSAEETKDLYGGLGMMSMRVRN